MAQKPFPEIKKKNLINSDAYKFLKENKEDPSILEGYKLDDKIMAATQGIKDFLHKKTR